MKKYIHRISILLMLFVISISLSSQNINLVSFNHEVNYAKGSGVSVIINPTDTFQIDNQFTLELSDLGGTWTNPILLNSVTEFYTPVINGTLPSNLAEGYYKLRIKSSNPVSEVVSTSFQVLNNVFSNIPTALSSLPNNTNFFNCNNDTKKEIIFGSHNQQEGALTSTLNYAQRTVSIASYNAAYIYDVKLIDVSNGNTSTLSANNGIFLLPDNLNIGTYAIQITQSENQVSSVFSLIFLFHGNGTSLGNSSSEEICVGSSVMFNVDISNSGIGRNYMGSKYLVNFGDGSKVLVLTQAQLLNNSKVEHVFLSSSCSELGSVFYVQKNLYSKGILGACDEYSKNGNGVKKQVNASQPPVSDFKAPLQTCLNKTLTCVNSTIPGFYGTSGCKEGSMFYWYYKKPGDTSFTYVTNIAWVDANNNLTIPASVMNVIGCWEIKLESQNQDLCQAISNKILSVQVEATPIASFTTSNDSVCENTAIVLSNTSNTIDVSCSTPTYKWTVVPENTQNNSAYQFISGTTSTTADAIVSFSKAGYYNLKLQITNSCGNFYSTVKRILIFGSPNVKFTNKYLSSCLPQSGSYTLDFAETTLNPFKNLDINSIESYQWNVFGENIDAADYSFENSTNANSANPKIKFKAFKTFKIEIVATGKCGYVVKDTIQLLLKEIPIINNQTLEQTICAGESTAAINLSSNLLGTNFTWQVSMSSNLNSSVQNGAGTLIPSVTINNNSDSVGVVTYQVKPIHNACEGNVVEFKVYVNPNVQMSQPKNYVICESKDLTISNFASVNKGGLVKYSWTNSDTRIGLADAGVGNIATFKTVNNTNSSIVSTVTVTPLFINKGVECSGEAKNFTITILPQPQLNAVDNILACSGVTIPNIDFTTTNVDLDTKYRWTNTNTSIGLAANGVGDIPSFKLINNSNVDVQAQIEVTPYFETEQYSCVGSSTTFTITVKSTPKAILSGNSDVCLGAQIPVITFKGQNGVAPYTFIYRLNNQEPISITTQSGVDSISFEAPFTEVGSYVYHLISVSDVSQTSCTNYSADSLVVKISPNPIISEQPLQSQVVCKGAVIDSLTVKYAGGAGVSKVQWYQNSMNQNSDGVAIEGANGLKYQPNAFNQPGIYYYYAIVTLNGSKCGSATSETAEVIVVSGPSITTQALQSQTLCENTVPQQLLVAATGGVGEFHYQWFVNDSASIIGAKKIDTAINANYLPATNVVGTQYYYCEISQSSIACNVLSGFSAVNIVKIPEIVEQPKSLVVCKDEQNITLSVKHNYGTSKVQYKWFVKDANSAQSATLVANADSSVLSVPTSVVGSKVYYCIVNFLSGGCSFLVSEVATVKVNQYPVIQNFDLMVESGTEFSLLPATIETNIIPAGTVYTWGFPQISTTDTIVGASNQTVATLNPVQTLINNTNRNITVSYTLLPKAGSCSGAEFKVNVLVYPKISPNVSINNVSCNGLQNGSIACNISGGVPFAESPAYHVQWTGPNGFMSTDANISNLAIGEYVLVITDQTSKTYSNSYFISEPQVLKVSTEPVSNVICNGESNAAIQVAVSGGSGDYKYSWTKNNSVFSTLENLNQLAVGTYQLTVTDANGCEAKSEIINITEPQKLNVELVSKTDNLCFAALDGAISIYANGGTPADSVNQYSYLWTGPNQFSSNLKDISGLGSGVYTVVVTDSVACTASLTVTVGQPDEMKLTVEKTAVSCYGKDDARISIQVTGGKAPYRAEWDNQATGFVQENLSAGMYKITVYDANNCSKSISVEVLKDSQFSINPEIKQVSCYGANDGSIKLNLVTGNAPLTLKWSDGSTSGNVRNNLAPGIYTVEINNGSPCIIKESFLIYQPTELKITDKITHAFDFENTYSGAIDITVEGGVKPYQYSWSNGATTEDLNHLAGGHYYVTVVDSNGCLMSQSFQVIRPNPIKVSIESTLEFDLNQNKPKRVNKAIISGGMPPYRLKWSNGTVSGSRNEIMQLCENISVLLQVTDTLNWKKDHYFNNEIPEMGIRNQIVDCNNYTYNYDFQMPAEIGSDVKYFWEFGDGATSTSYNPTHTYMRPGNYRVKANVSANEFSTSFENEVLVDSLPILKLLNEPKLCYGDSVTLVVAGASEYEWNNGIKGNKVVLKSDGMYYVTGRSRSGCTSTMYFNASYYADISYSISSDKDVITPADPTINFWSSDVSLSNYYWNFGDSQADYGSSVSHTYEIDKPREVEVKLYVTSPYGCRTEITKKIWLQTTDIPNAFSPNGDGINDLFLKGYVLKVFNSNGILLYDGIEGWDGTYKGKPVALDTYYYTVSFIDIDGPVNKTGFVTLVR